MTTAQTSAERSAERSTRKAALAESAVRIEAAFEATRAIARTGKCPCCGSKLVRNLSLAGWWQCEQFGSDTFRARPAESACNWQGFTE